jgi:hypothetical protein
MSQHRLPWLLLLLQQPKPKSTYSFFPIITRAVQAVDNSKWLFFLIELTIKVLLKDKWYIILPDQWNTELPKATTESLRFVIP